MRLLIFSGSGSGIGDSGDGGYTSIYHLQVDVPLDATEGVKFLTVVYLFDSEVFFI